MGTVLFGYEMINWTNLLENYNCCYCSKFQWSKNYKIKDKLQSWTKKDGLQISQRRLFHLWGSIVIKNRTQVVRFMQSDRPSNVTNEISNTIYNPFCNPINVFFCFCLICPVSSNHKHPKKSLFYYCSMIYNIQNYEYHMSTYLLALNWFGL